MPGSVATGFGKNAATGFGKNAATGFGKNIATGANSVTEKLAGGVIGAGTENAAPGSDWKIWPEDVAEVVRLLVRMPARTMISQVEIRPALPKRS
jgi:hypothetical protein